MLVQHVTLVTLALGNEGEGVALEQMGDFFYLRLYLKDHFFGDIRVARELIYDNKGEAEEKLRVWTNKVERLLEKENMSNIGEVYH